MSTTTATIEGNVTRVDRRGKQIFCFEGTGLRKVGVGQSVELQVAGTRYRGELVAIGPTRAIVLISASVADHGITTPIIDLPVTESPLVAVHQ